MSKIKDQIVTSINSYGDMTKVASSLIAAVCFGEPTISAVRSLLINPITNKLIPVFAANYMMSTYTAIYAMMELYDKKQINSEIFGMNDDKLNSLMEMLKEEPREVLYDLHYEAKKGKKNFIIKYKGNLIYVDFVNDEEKWLHQLKLQFIGINSRSLYNDFISKYEQMEKYVKNGGEDSEKLKRKVTVRSVGRSGRLSYSSCTVPKTIILDHVQNELDDILEMVSKSEEVVTNYDINKTTGILLYGPAGTGKSTIARWLAMKLDRTLVLTTPSSLDMTIDEISRDTTRKYIMLIEDIDLLFTDRRKMVSKGKSKNVDDENDDENIDFNATMNAQTGTLFQVLDGVLSNKNLIVIATTNYFDRLDPALIRDGRFDFKIEVNGLSYEAAKKVCERFDVDPGEIMLSRWKTPISPASLQTFILKYKVTNHKNLDLSKLIDDGEEEETTKTKTKKSE